MSNRPTRTATRPKPAPVAPENRPLWAHPLAWVAGIVFVAAIAAAAIGFSSSRSDDPAGGVETAFAEALGDPLPRLEDGVVDAAIGQTAPRLAALELGGERVIVGGDGTARLIGFFAHWCPHCQRELPLISEWLSANPVPDGVEVLAVSTAVQSSADNYPPSAWFEREGWPGRILLDSEESDLAAGYGLPAYPYWVVVDADGTVVERRTGGFSTSELDGLMAALST